MTRALRRVAITGLGIVSPIGNSVPDFTKSLFDGRSGAGPLTRFPGGHLGTQIGAEVKNFPSEFRDIKISFARASAREAIRNAFGEGFSFSRNLGLRAGLSLGMGLELFSLDDLAEMRRSDFRLPENKRDLMTFLNTPSEVCTQLISHEFQFNRPPLTHISACSASTDAIGAAFRAISEGEADWMLAGGTDSMMNPIGFGAFCRIGAMTARNATPLQASRPFDADRDGFLLGEGAAFLVLEEETLARSRGKEILAFVSGYGNSLDAHSVSDPHPEGLGALLAMQRALRSAGLSHEDVSAINAHGTGTPKNDPVEAAAIRVLLGPRALEVPVHSTKSLIGHLISAAGAAECVAVVRCLKEQKLHPTANLEKVAEGCGLRHVVRENLVYPLRHILKNSFGFGGQNACLVLSAATEKM